VSFRCEIGERRLHYGGIVLAVDDDQVTDGELLRGLRSSRGG
jgi:hypothetical protein